MGVGGHCGFQILNNDLGHEDVTSLHISVDPEIKQVPPQPLVLPVRNPNSACRLPSTTQFLTQVKKKRGSPGDSRDAEGKGIQT